MGTLGGIGIALTEDGWYSGVGASDGRTMQAFLQHLYGTELFS